MVYSSKLVEQYAALKEEAGPDCVLLMQVGSFMQVQGEDARAISAVTGLKLQMAGDVNTPVVLGGFPKSGLDAYVGQLVRAGHSVAIAVQDDQKERKITEVIRVSKAGKEAEGHGAV
jgi:DNA mismatch repair ATPase MutS